MVIIDATTLLLLIDPTAKPPTDPKTRKPVEKCKERLEFLIETLSDASTRVVVPTPVLSEVLVGAGNAKAQYLNELTTSHVFMIAPFDIKAAVELAYLLDAGGKPPKAKLTKQETWAKVKFDRQIVAIAKSNNVLEIYTDDENLSDVAGANGLTVHHTWDLPQPPVKAQPDLPFPEPQASTDEEPEN